MPGRLLGGGANAAGGVSFDRATTGGRIQHERRQQVLAAERNHAGFVHTGCRATVHGLEDQEAPAACIHCRESGEDRESSRIPDGIPCGDAGQACHHAGWLRHLYLYASVHTGPQGLPGDGALPAGRTCAVRQRSGCHCQCRRRGIRVCCAMGPTGLGGSERGGRRRRQGCNGRHDGGRRFHAYGGRNCNFKPQSRWSARVQEGVARCHGADCFRKRIQSGKRHCTGRQADRQGCHQEWFEVHRQGCYQAAAKARCHQPGEIAA